MLVKHVQTDASCISLNWFISLFYFRNVSKQSLLWVWSKAREHILLGFLPLSLCNEIPPPGSKYLSHQSCLLFSFFFFFTTKTQWDNTVVVGTLFRKHWPSRNKVSWWSGTYVWRPWSIEEYEYQEIRDQQYSRIQDWQFPMSHKLWKMLVHETKMLYLWLETQPYNST